MVIFNSYVSHYQRVQITATNGQNGWESPPWSSMDLRCFLQQQEETCNALGFFHVKNDTWMYKYPLVNIQKTMGNHHAINGKFHYKWPFSIAMLVYQMVFFLLAKNISAIHWFHRRITPNLGSSANFMKRQDTKHWTPLVQTYWQCCRFQTKAWWLWTWI